MIVDMKGYDQSMDRAKAKARELGQSGKEASTSFSTLNERLNQVGASSAQIDKINARLRKANPQLLQRQIAEVTKELHKLGASSSEIAKVTKELERGGVAATGTMNEIEQLGMAYGGLAIAMAAVIAQAVQTSAIFEQSMARVKAITQATSEEFSRLRDQAIELGATTVFTSSQAADAMGYLAMA